MSPEDGELSASKRKERTRDYRADPKWQLVVRELGLDVPPLEASPVTAGARSQREVVPTVPPGWRFSPGSQGVGVLAPRDIPLALGRAEQLMRAGKSASALWLLQRANGADPNDDTRLVVLEAMAGAYEALDRGVLAARARQMRACVCWPSVRDVP